MLRFAIPAEVAVHAEAATRVNAALPLHALLRVLNVDVERPRRRINPNGNVFERTVPEYQRFYVLENQLKRLRHRGSDARDPPLDDVHLREARAHCVDNGARVVRLPLLRDGKEAANLRIGEILHKIERVVAVLVDGVRGKNTLMTGTGALGNDVLSSGNRPPVMYCCNCSAPGPFVSASAPPKPFDSTTMA